MKYIDIHSHLNIDTLHKDKDAVIARMRENDTGTITIGVDFESSKLAIDFARAHDDIWASVGLHPTDNLAEGFDRASYRELAKDKNVVCIGECGLDYFRDQKPETKTRQREIFIQHIELALETSLPLMIHARPSKGAMDAYEDALEILEQYKKDHPGLMANFHFFVGDLGIAKRIVDLDFTASFDGPITFTSEYDEVIEFMPMENIMAETDAPYAAPAPYRGKTCEPFMVCEIVKKIAQVKGLTEDQAAEKLLNNAQRVFNLNF